MDEAVILRAASQILHLPWNHGTLSRSRLIIINLKKPQNRRSRYTSHHHLQKRPGKMYISHLSCMSLRIDAIQPRKSKPPQGSTSILPFLNLIPPIWPLRIMIPGRCLIFVSIGHTTLAFNGFSPHFQRTLLVNSFVFSNDHDHYLDVSGLAF